MGRYFVLPAFRHRAAAAFFACALRCSGDTPAQRCPGQKLDR
jgi:hypothetical protein